MGSGDMIGHDPLAWIKEEPAEESPVEATVAMEQSAVALQADVETPEAPSAVTTEAVVEAVAAVVEEPVAEEPPKAVAEEVIDDTGALQMGDALVISNVGKTRAEWMDRITGGIDSPITLEAGDIQVIDTAGLQLVIALIRELNEDGVSWQWGGCSELVKESARQLDLTTQLSL